MHVLTLSYILIYVLAVEVDAWFVPTAAELRGITICDKKLHNELLYATPSVRGNPTMICAGGNAGV